MEIPHQLRMRFSAIPALFAIVAIAFPFMQEAHADYPERPIRIIIPTAPGGPLDITGRLISPLLSKVIGQPVIVENRAGVNVGNDALVESQPNGYTTMISASAITQAPALYHHLRFDPIKDIKPVADLSRAPYVMVVSSKVSAKTPQELIALAKQNPGKLNAAAGGIGSRLSVELFQLKNNMKVEIIPYSGTGPAALAIIKAEADFSIMEGSPFVSQIPAGQVRALAVAGDQRLPFIKDVPTMAEVGMPDYKTGISVGLYATGATPGNIVQKLHDSVNSVLVLPEVKEKFQSLGAYPSVTSQAEFAQWYVQEIQTWKDIVAQAKIPPLD